MPPAPLSEPEMSVESMLVDADVDGAEEVPEEAGPQALGQAVPAAHVAASRKEPKRALEVSGSLYSLQHHIDRVQDIDAPDLCSFNAWQKWRRTEGRRPRMNVDGYSTSPA